MVEGSTSMAGKHKGSQVGEPASKKKRNIILCCEICEEEHFTPHCPLLHGPKPNAMFSGLAGDGLGFFHIPYSKVAKATQKVSATALIKIIEGSVPAELVKKELARAIPIKWDWEVCVHGNNSYIVPFPCQVELQRMISMKRLRTDNNEGVMSFEEWNNEIKPKQQLQKVWVQVYGVPHEIRSFLPLWAVGSILGVTQRVDMRYLKKTGVVRLMVAVLDVNCIPEDADIVVDDSLYEIFFKVDHIVHSNGGDPEDFDEDDDLDPENRNRDTDQDMEDLHNQNKIGTTFSGPSNDTDISKSFSKSHQAPNDEAPTAYEVQVAEGAIDKAVQILLEDISASVVAEIDKSSDVYSAVPRPLDGPSSEEILVQEISKDHTLSDEVLDTVTSVQPNSLLTSVTEVANGCNGAHVSAVASTAGQEAECPEPMVSRVAMTHILEDQLREDGSGQQDQIIPLQEVFAVSENGPDCGAFAPAVMKEKKSSSIPDFLEFPRVDLQALCKKNGIRANSTNVTMASALQLLDVVVGVEDLRGSAAVGAVSSVDFAAEEKEVDKNNNDEENMLLSDSKRMVHLRRSQRSSAMSDEHTLKKVERRVAACNLEFTGYFQGNILAAVLGTAAA